MVAETIPPEPLGENVTPEITGNSLAFMSLALGVTIADKKVLLTGFELCIVEANQPLAPGKSVGVNSELLSTETPWKSTNVEV